MTMEMKVTLDRVNDAVLFNAENESGNLIRIDGSNEVGGVGGGFRPMQLLLAGIGGCSAIDLVNILKKQKQNLKDVKIVVTGSRTRTKEKNTSVFTKIHLHYMFSGTLEDRKVEHALRLAVEKYCSVGEMLGKTAAITYDYEIASE